MSVVEVAVTAINASHSCFGTVAAKRKCTTMLRQLLKGPSTSTSSYTRPAGSPNENHLASGRRGSEPTLAARLPVYSTVYTGKFEGSWDSSSTCQTSKL